MAKDDYLAGARKRDGSLLRHTNGYISWKKGEDITLDGEFSADALRAIADYIDAENAKST